MKSLKVFTLLLVAYATAEDVRWTRHHRQSPRPPVVTGQPIPNPTGIANGEDINIHHHHRTTQKPGRCADDGVGGGCLKHSTPSPMDEAEAEGHIGHRTRHPKTQAPPSGKKLKIVSLIGLKKN